MAKAKSKRGAERKPDAEYRIKTGKHEVQVYSFGEGDEVLGARLQPGESDHRSTPKRVWWPAHGARAWPM